MRPPEDPEVLDWLQKVAEDYRVAEALAELAEPLDDSICFCCQQAAEKLLKALIVASGPGLGRTTQRSSWPSWPLPNRVLPMSRTP